MLINGRLRVYFLNLPGIALGALRFFNYGHDVDALWKYGGDGLIYGRSVTRRLVSLIHSRTIHSRSLASKMVKEKFVLSVQVLLM